MTPSASQGSSRGPGRSGAGRARAGVRGRVRRRATTPELKAESAMAQLFIRTGEATPHANAILQCGVPL